MDWLAKPVRQTMQEVCKSTVSSKAMRFTFAVLLSEFVVSERLGTELWEAHKDRMCAQPRKDREEQEKELVLSATEVNAALCDIHTLVREMMGKSELKLQQLGLPELSEESALTASTRSRKQLQPGAVACLSCRVLPADLPVRDPPGLGAEQAA